MIRRFFRRLRRRGYGPWKAYYAPVKISGRAVSMSAFDAALRADYLPALRAALGAPSPFLHHMTHGRFQIAPGAWHYTADLGQKELPGIAWGSFDDYEDEDY